MHWPLGSVKDMQMYLSTSPNGNVITERASTYRKSRDEELPQFVWKNTTYGEYTDTRVINVVVNFPEVRLLFQVVYFKRHVVDTHHYIACAEERFFVSRYISRQKWYKP